MGKREADADGIEYYYDSNVGARGDAGLLYILSLVQNVGHL